MTTNESPDRETPEHLNLDDQPAWGDAPTTPPAGSGSEPGPGYGEPSASRFGEQPGSGTGTGADAASGPQAPTNPGARFFDRMHRLGMVRPDPGQGRMLAGVAAGIARRYGIDPLPVRIAFVLASLVGGLGVLLYGLGWMFLPQPDGRIHAQEILRGRITAGFVGALLTILVVAHHVLPFLVVALVIWMVVHHRRTSRTQAA